MLNWANRFNIFLFLDSCNYADRFAAEDWVLAAGVTDEFLPTTNLLPKLNEWIAGKKFWLFGHLNYDLKNEIEQLCSLHPDHIGFPDVYFFEPEVIIRKTGPDISIICNTMDATDILADIQATAKTQAPLKPSLQIQQRFSKEAYIATIQRLQQHILRGDCYEINFCQEFFAEHAVIDPLSVYNQLIAVSPTPFAGFYKMNDKYLLCASPERFLQKKGNTLISQPIKGTIKRNTENALADADMKQQLQQSTKDQSENVMVVDLVRNDLSKICTEDSVYVSELYGIYTFPQVHQMISTVKGQLKENTGFADILRATFPMGSMTGAPKVRVMQLAEQYEQTKRGIYSGCIGYINPDKDFDFNVVIRSIMYNATTQYLSYQVGGGITFYSEPEKEYEECLLKAAAIKKVLQ